MPHKHRRDKSKNPSSHDLPPTSRALPLPVGKLPHDTTKSHPLSLKDDTPRAFTRLMTFTSTDHKTPRGLDDGLAPKSAKKRKRDPSDPAPEPPAHRNNADQATTTTSTTVAAAATITAPKILPSERLSDFAARVPKERGGGANVKVLGGLKRQEELKEARRKVVEGYRKMMSERKGDGFLKVGSIA
ncbi:MAG: hypothetical protein LQ342_002995 [Letrouitia transgressa]|nr:MAG: hypothetical protein LQ342_002995 [Letrouitia transgressa]